VASGKSGCLFALFGGLLESRRDEPIASTDEDDDLVEAEIVEQLPYKVRDDFLSPTEASFFVALVAAVGNKAVVCPKVRLGDVLFCSAREQFWRHTNRVNQKHVDFLICSPDKLRPILAVELDDASHQKAAVQERDRFKTAAFEAAGLPLVRIMNQRTWDVSTLAGQLKPYFQQERIAYASLAAKAEPICPKCGVAMVLRRAKRGQQAGEQFFGCPNFPKCREIQQGR
jgi:very-short-patch-repair endonuclease